MRRSWFVMGAHRLLLLGIVLCTTFLAYGHTRDAAADVAGSPCTGNVCSGSIVVGGQTVQYSYTQHLSPSGDLRIRLNGGVYNTNSLVSMIIFGLPTFSTWDKLANPANGAVFLPIEDVNPGRTAYERRDNDGCVAPATCIVDQVLSVRFAALAPGTYPFSLSVVQNGDSGGRSLTFYVDAAAPANTNETATWGAIGLTDTCADHIDNDIDFLPDCADVQCVGSVGDVGSGALCQQPESTCNDLFDNDADGLPDCLDSSCDGLVGQPAGTALCQYGNEFGAGFCNDGFNNDGDIDTASGLPLTDCVDNAWVVANGGNASRICWKTLGSGCPLTEISCSDFIDNDKDMSYDDSWDIAPLTGGELLASGELRCLDYDCAGDSACPSVENKTAGGADADAQCFNTVDDDLDTDIDCADDNCKGVVNPGNPAQVCFDKEFDLGGPYQYCANAFDDDGDGPQDCSDSDCSRQFGNCGPCPDREDYAYDACADAKDNDTDGMQNCADTVDCTGDLGALGDAAMCAAAENTDELCGDGFNNNPTNNALIDCADPGCDGRLGPLNQVCHAIENAAAWCGDGSDNDGDGLIDCADPNCWGVGSWCAAKDWADASSCVTVPSDDLGNAFTGNNPTILVDVRTAVHVGQTDILHFTGSATYSSVTIIAGDNTDSSKYYPYALPYVGSSPQCELSGPTAARFDFTAISGHAVQIYNTPGPDIVGFDITLTCNVPGTPAAAKTYPLSLSALKEPGGVPEYGDLSFMTTLYEATIPSVTEIEVEGESTVGNVVRVPYGGTAAAHAVRMRIVPNDPGGAPPATSGICRCGITVNSLPYATGPTCVTTPISFLTDTVLVSLAETEDGAGNTSPGFGSPPTTINVTPTALTPLSLTNPSQPFFKDGVMDVTASAEFLTGSTDTFGVGTCEVFIRLPNGTIVNSPGPTQFFGGAPLANFIDCNSQITLPSGLPDGMYLLSLRVRDSDNDWVESNRKAIYICNTVPGPTGTQNGCQFADFDRDGVAEGLFTVPPMYASQPLSCDNCLGLSNSSQEDLNANGIGDECEPKENFGRCEIDMEITCRWDSDDVAHDCPTGELCCPGPSLADIDPIGNPGVKKDPQMCAEGWGICSIGGAICFSHAECTEGGDPLASPGYGLCSDGLTECKTNLDCSLLPDPVCTGANVCENLLFPWLQTLHGNLFSGKRITALDTPPAGQFNATYCITAKEIITNFSSELCDPETGTVDTSSPYALPQSGNEYRSVLGTLDIVGLRAGKYGNVTTVAAAALDTTILSYAGGFDGRVIRVAGNATVSAQTIRNGSGPTVGGAGTVFIDGGDLTITGNITYEGAAVNILHQLASMGWVVTGNIYVQGDVGVLSGAFYSGGADGFWSVAPPLASSDTQLVLHGLAVARKFVLSRAFKSTTEGSERFVYDGRAVVNPPPGFADVTKSMPAFSDSLPQ